MSEKVCHTSNKFVLGTTVMGQSEGILGAVKQVCQITTPNNELETRLTSGSSFYFKESKTLMVEYVVN